MKMKRWLSCTLALAMLLGLMGCGGTSDEAPNDGSGSSEDEIVINYPTFQIGTNTAAPVVEELVSRFNEEYAGQYRIEVEEIPGDANYADRIQVQISSGKLPPVVYGGGYSLLDLALEADLVVDLTDVVNEDPEWASMYENDAWQAANCRDGKIYASSNEGQLIGYFYNKELFDQAGIQPATTWNEFFDNCDKLLAAGITPLAMDTADGAWVSMLLMGAMVATSGDEGLEFMNTKYPTDYNIEPVVNAVAEMQKWYQNYTTLDAVGGAYENAANNFFSGNVAMICNGPWMIGDFSDTSKTPDGFDQNVGVAAYPGNFVYDAPIEGMFVTKQDDPALEEAAIAMVKFFTSPESQQLALEMQGMVPAAASVEITDTATTNFPLLGEFLNTRYVPTPSPATWFPAYKISSVPSCPTWPMAPTHRSSSARSSQILLRQTPCPDLSARDGVDETPEARDRNLRTKDRVALAAARSSLSLDKEMEFDETKKWRMDRPVFSASMYPLYPDLRNPAGNGVRYIAVRLPPAAPHLHLCRIFQFCSAVYGGQSLLAHLWQHGQVAFYPLHLPRDSWYATSLHPV